MTRFESRSPFGKRTYSLTDNAIIARGEIPLRGDFEATLSLGDLDARFERFWLRSHRLIFGGWFFGGGMFAYTIETGVARMDGLGLVGSLTLLWIFASATLLFVGLKKYQLARFKTKSGVGVLEVFEDGPMKASFEEFVAEIARRIALHDEKNLTSRNEKAGV